MDGLMLDRLYKRGLAGGLPVIKTDMICFRFRDEVFELPTYEILNHRPKIVRYDGVCYVAKVKDLRRFKKKLERSHA